MWCPLYAPNQNLIFLMYNPISQRCWMASNPAEQTKNDNKKCREWNKRREKMRIYHLGRITLRPHKKKNEMKEWMVRIEKNRMAYGREAIYSRVVCLGLAFSDHPPKRREHTNAHSLYYTTLTRWIMPAEWRCFMPHSIWYSKYDIRSWSRSICMTWHKFASMSSMTR